jgi:hypothetical protein
VRSILLAAWLAAGTVPPAPPEALPPPPARGTVVERIATSRDPAQTYALYVPNSYQPDRPAPILYAFDSRGNAGELAARLRAGAERYGWIVASPYSSSNLIPMEENFKIMSALWADTHARLAIDDRRIYALGFSGLARFVCMLGLTAPESLAGVIGANGGFPLGHPPTRSTPFPFFSTVGDTDFNYYELRDLDGKLAQLGLPHRLELFAGSNEWPPEELLTLAIGWMELQAMKRGERDKSAAVIDPLWNADLARARADEAAARPLEAEEAYAGLLTDYAGLRDAKDLAEAERHRSALAASEPFQRELRARQERDRRDREYLEKVPEILHGARTDLRPDAVTELLTALRVPELKRQAASAADPQERLSAERLLYAVTIQAGLYMPQELSELKQYDRALFYLQIAEEIEPGVPHIPFRMATTWAKKGNRRRALAELAVAVDEGWTDLVALESERAFDPLRQNDVYKKIVAELLRRQRPTP